MNASISYPSLRKTSAEMFLVQVGIHDSSQQYHVIYQCLYCEVAVCALVDGGETCGNCLQKTTQSFQTTLNFFMLFKKNNSRNSYLNRSNYGTGHCIS